MIIIPIRINGNAAITTTLTTVDTLPKNPLLLSLFSSVGVSSNTLSSFGLSFLESSDETAVAELPADDTSTFLSSTEEGRDS